MPRRNSEDSLSLLFAMAEDGIVSAQKSLKQARDALNRMPIETPFELGQYLGDSLDYAIHCESLLKNFAADHGIEW